MSLLDNITDDYITSPSGKRYTNNNNIPLLTARMYILAHENGYKGTGSTVIDGKPKISVTTLIGIPKQYLYSQKYPDLNPIRDVSSFAASARGTIFHNALEKSIKEWGDTSVESETRVQRDFAGYAIEWVLDGEWDVFEDRMIKDLKTTSNWKLAEFLKEKKAIETKDLLNTEYSISEAKEKYPVYFSYVLQLSIYKWLRREGNEKDEGAIIFMLTNGGGHQRLPVDTEISIPLIPKDKLEKWMQDRLGLLKNHLDNDTLPECTPSERMQTEGQWKLQRISKKGDKYITVKNTTSNYYEGFKSLTANLHVNTTKHNPDKIVVKEPQNLMCDVYCDYKDICEQNNT